MAGPRLAGRALTGGRAEMRHRSVPQAAIATLVVGAMLVSITGLFGAAGPTIAITSPKSGAKVTGAIKVAASMRGDGDVGYVILVVDEDRPYSTNRAPYSFELDTSLLADGAHRIRVEAYDNFGLVAASKAITIHVRNGAARAAPATPALSAKVAAKPSPPTRLAAPPPPGRPVSAAAEEQVAARAVSPTVSTRGPLPEPSRVAAAAPTKAAEAMVPESGVRPSFAAAAVSDQPHKGMAAPRMRSHTIIMDGRVVEMVVEPYVERGRVQVPMRSVFEGLGARVSWDAAARTARGATPAMTVEVPVGSRIARVNGRSVDMGTSAVVREARVMISLRFFAGVADATVDWDRENRVASLHLSRRMLAEKDND